MSSKRVVSPEHIESILVVAAHPDDMEAFCAGTLAQLIDRGAAAHMLLATSGDKGAREPGITSREIARRREEEARVAAAQLGMAGVEFLGYPDGDVENTRDLREQIVKAIRRWKPDILFTFDPEHPYPPYISHPDHRAIGRATLDAIYPLARDALTFPEHAQMGLEPHKVRQIWLFASSNTDSYVDISGTIDRKIQARLAHQSQTADPDELDERWRKRAAATGAEVDLPYAEAFAVVRIDN